MKLDGSQDRCAEAGEGRLENHGRMQTALYGNRRWRRRTTNRLTDMLLSFVAVNVRLIPEQAGPDL